MAARRRKILLWILVGALVLILLLLAAIQVVLWTDWPRQWIIGAMRSQLQMDVSLGELDTGWGGRTVVRDLSLELPLADDPFLRAEEVRLNHTGLLRLLITRRFELQSLAGNGIDLHLRQDDRGRWNIDDVLARLSNGAGDSSGSPADPPDLSISGLNLRIVDAAGRSSQIGPVSVEGRQEDRVYAFQAGAPPYVEARGQVVLSALSPHEITFAVSDLHDMAPEWVPEQVAPMQVRGRWKGLVREGNLEGTLTLEPSQVAEIGLEGPAEIRTAEQAVTVRPQGLIVGHPSIPGGQVRLADGTIRYADDEIQLSRIAAETESLLITTSGEWDQAVQQVLLRGQWLGGSGGGMRHEGQWQATIDMPQVGVQQAQLTLSTRIGDPVDGWRARVEVAGSGREWTDSQWSITAPTLVRLQAGETVELGPASTEIRIQWPRIVLRQAEVEAIEDLTMQGQYLADEQTWDFTLDARGLTYPETLAPLQVHLAAGGNAEQARITAARVENRAGSLRLTGQVDLGEVTRMTARIRGEAAWPGVVQGEDVEGRIQGRVEIDADVNGTLDPMKIQGEGRLVARSIEYQERSLPELTVPLAASWTEQGLVFDTSPFDYLRARWQAAGRTAPETGALTVTAQVDDFPLPSLAEYFDVPAPSRGQASASVDIALPAGDTDALAVTGRWQAQDLRYQAVEVAQATGRLELADGQVTLHDILLQQADGSISGTVAFAVDRPSMLTMDLRSDDWVVDVNEPQARLLVDSTIRMEVDAAQKAVSGEAAFSTAVSLAGENIGSLDGEVETRNEVITVVRLEGDLLGGDLSGSGVFPIRRLTESNMTLTWNDVQLDPLDALTEQLAPLSGTASGRIQLAAAEDPRALEPLELQARINLREASFGATQLSGAQLTAYIGPERTVLTPSTLSIFGGLIRFRGRMSAHGEEQFFFLNTSFEQIDLNQAAKAFSQQANPVSGRLSGKGTIMTSADASRLSAQLDLQIAESDLANNEIIGTLYNIINFQPGDKPSGEGEMSLRLNGTRLEIPSFRYFNRGIEVRGSGMVEDLAAGDESPISGAVIASTRPFAELDIPGTGSLDRLLSAIQTSATAVRVGGTVGDPDPKVVPLPEISGAIRRLVTGRPGE